MPVTHEKLFEPIRINTMEVKNRFAMPAMGTGLCVGMGGYVSERIKDYYAARAKGGTGLIIIETVMIDWESGRNTDAVMSIDDDKFIPKEHFVGTGRWEQKDSVSCAVNADMGREREYEIKPAEKPLRIVVIGGGPAGMEAARVAALRRHHVILFETSSELSKTLPAAEKSAGRYIGKINRYLARQVVKLGVDIRLGTLVSADLILSLGPDRIILAAEGALTEEFFESLKGKVSDLHRIDEGLEKNDIKQLIRKGARMGRFWEV